MEKDMTNEGRDKKELELKKNEKQKTQVKKYIK